MQTTRMTKKEVLGFSIRCLLLPNWVGDSKPVSFAASTWHHNWRLNVFCRLLSMQKHADHPRSSARVCDRANPTRAPNHPHSASQRHVIRYRRTNQLISNAQMSLGRRCRGLWLCCSLVYDFVRVRVSGAHWFLEGPPVFVCTLYLGG